MANKKQKTGKHLQIDSASSAIVVIVSLAAVVTAFSLVSVKTLMSQRAYQSRVISQQESTLKTAEDNLVALKELNDTYEDFDNASTNIIGGVKDGNGPNDGSNSRIILDALPSEYDFPALVSSIENLLVSRGFRVQSLTGVDDAALAELPTETSPTPREIPFQLEVTGSYAAIQDLVKVIERSVRPINIINMEVAGSDDTITLQINAKTFYQPGKNLDVTKKVIK